jgi:hypothetical protein
MLKPNMQLLTLHVELDADFCFEYNKGKYNVNPRLLLWKKAAPIEMFAEGNPHPLDFNNAHKIPDMMPNAENYQRVMEQKLIKDYLTEQKLLLIILVCCIIIILIVAAIALKVFGVFDRSKTEVPKKP